MTKQELRQLAKRQNQVCGIINRLGYAGKISDTEGTHYVGLVLFNPCLTLEWLEEIATELSAKV